jgi:hypothetical protein
MADSTKHDGRMGSSLTFFMQVTFQTSGSLVLLPWTFATLGYVLGPIAMVLVFAVVLRAQSFLNTAAVAARSEEEEEEARLALATLPGLAARMGGRRLGSFASWLQGANMLLVMPTQLNVTGAALQYVVNTRPGSSAHCNIIYVLVVAAPAVLVTQFVRRIGHKTGALAGISFLIICTKCCLIIYSILTHADLYESDAAPVAGLGEAVRTADVYSWAHIVSALGNLLWFFAPVFLNTELVAVMKYPQQVHRQLITVAACLVVLYTAVGTVGAATWGIAVRGLINLQLPYDWTGVAVNCLLMYGGWLDYLISEIVFTGHLQQLLEPGFDKSDFSAGACGRWLLYSLPGNLCAVGLVCFVPKLETLVGVISATCVTLASFTLPALAGLHWGRHGGPKEAGATGSGVEEGVASATTAAGDAQEEGGPQARLVPALEIRTSLELGQWLIALLGLAAMVALVTSSVSSILNTDYGGESFFCDVVG